MGRREAPVPAGPLREFAEGLRELRARAPGAPTYRELARRARYSPSALSDAASGRRLPSWEVTKAFVAACGGDLVQWRERWSQLDTQLRAIDPALLPASEASAQPTEADQAPESDAGTTETQLVSSAAALPPAVAALAPSDPRTIGPFRLLGRLGGGSMGRVYLAMSKAGRPVALKVVRTDLADDPRFRRRFAAEIAAVRRVQGPFTAAVLAADTDAEQPWLATTYLPGPCLQDAVESGGPMPPAVVAGLAAGIAEALAAIHAAGVLHRDLKPGNVVLEADGPKLIDFGVARALDASRLTRTGEGVGTVPFMAPEQAEGGPATAAADMFSLGCVLAYAATGRTPFGDDSSAQVLYRIAHADPDPAALDCGDPRLRELIIRCLSKDPHHRPTPAEVIEACGGQRPHQTAWLPTAAASMLATRDEELTRLLAKAATHRTVVRVKLSAIPLTLAAVVAAALVLTLGGAPSSSQAGPPTSPTPTTSPPLPPASTRPADPSPGDSRNGEGSTPSPHGPSGQEVSVAGGHPGGGEGAGGGDHAQTVTWTGYSGDNCASSGAAPISFTGSGDWNTTTGGAYLDGCKAAKYRNLTGNSTADSDATWAFTPGTVVTGCTFTVHIAAGTWATNAQYEIYDTNNSDAQPIDSFTLDQHAYDNGGWYTTRRFTFTTGTIDLALTNAGSNRYGVVADIVTTTCT